MLALASVLAGVSASSVLEAGAGAPRASTCDHQKNQLNDPDEDCVHEFKCHDGKVFNFDESTVWWQSCHAEGSYIVECPSMFPQLCAFQSGGPTACVQIVEDCPLGLPLTDKGPAKYITVKKGEYKNTTFPPLELNKDCGSLIRMEVHEYQCEGENEKPYNMEEAPVSAWLHAKDSNKRVKFCPPTMQYPCKDQTEENIICAQNPLVCFQSQVWTDCGTTYHDIWSWIYYQTPVNEIHPHPSWELLEVGYDKKCIQPSAPEKNPFDLSNKTPCQPEIPDIITPDQPIKPSEPQAVGNPTYVKHDFTTPEPRNNKPVSYISQAYKPDDTCSYTETASLISGGSEIPLIVCGRNILLKSDETPYLPTSTICRPKSSTKEGENRCALSMPAYTVGTGPGSQNTELTISFVTLPAISETGECPTQAAFEARQTTDGCGLGPAGGRRSLAANQNRIRQVQAPAPELTIPPIPIVLGAAPPVGLLPLWIALGILLLLLLLALLGFAAAKKTKPAVFEEDQDHMVGIVASYGGAGVEEEGPKSAPPRKHDEALE